MAFNLGNGLSQMGSSIAQTAGEGELNLQKSQLEEQKLRLASSLAGQQYDVASKRLALIPQAVSMDAYLKAVGHPGGLKDFGVNVSDMTQGGSDGSAPAPAPPQNGLINTAAAGTDSGSQSAPPPSSDAAAGPSGGGQSAAPTASGTASAFPKGAPMVMPMGEKGKPMGVPLPPGWTPQQAAIAGPDALKNAWTEWAKPQNMRANSTLSYYDFGSGQMKALTRTPEMPPGYYYDADTNSAVQISGAAGAIANSAKAKSMGESQGSLPADLTKIGAQGEQSRTTASFQKGLDVATDLVPSYDSATQKTTMITKADALKMTREGNWPIAPPDGAAKPIPSDGGPGLQKDGTYKTSNGTLIPPPPVAPKGTGLQSAPSAADKATQESYAPVIKAWQDSITPSVMAEQRFQAIAEAMKATQTGAWAQTKTDLAQHLMSYGVLNADSAKALLDADPAQAQIILKNNFGTALNTLSAARLGRITQNEIFAMQKNLPALGNQPEANLAMIAQGIGTSRFQQGLANDWNQARQMGYADPLAYEANWIKANPLQGFIDQAKKEVGPLKGAAPQFPTPPPDAVAHLKALGPSAKGQFDEIFGPGSADKAMGR